MNHYLRIFTQRNAAILLLLGFASDLTLLAALAVLIAFCSASQDIVFDA